MDEQEFPDEEDAKEDAKRERLNEWVQEDLGREEHARDADEVGGHLSLRSIGEKRMSVMDLKPETVQEG